MFPHMIAYKIALAGVKNVSFYQFITWSLLESFKKLHDFILKGWGEQNVAKVLPFLDAEFVVFFVVYYIATVD